jgi:hypothetical protein
MLQIYKNLILLFVFANWVGFVVSSKIHYGVNEVKYYITNINPLTPNDL